jgi:hypothetical protein
VTRELPLADLEWDAGIQVRVAIDPAVVADYAEHMRAGVVFPPITVFSDGGTHRLADGFHRFLAAQRAGRTTLLADVHPGTREEALWFALGANRTNGQRLTEGDKTRAVTLAFATWPTKLNREIADQVGCSTSLVSKVICAVAANTGGKPVLHGQSLKQHERREAVREMVVAGYQSIAIHKALQVHSSVIAGVRRKLGRSTSDYSRSATKSRYEHMREMATTGHSSFQIADALGLSVERCRLLLKQAGIPVPADAVTRGIHHHDSNRIMARIVADAEDLAAGANLIDFRTLDRAQFAEWIATLRQARTTLGTFIKRLTQEQVYDDDDEAGESQAVENSSGADRADAGPAGAGGAARVSPGSRRQDRGGLRPQQAGLPHRQSA